MIIHTYLEYLKDGEVLGKIALPEASDSELRIVLYKHFIKTYRYNSNLPPDRVRLVSKRIDIEKSEIKEVVIDSENESGRHFIDEIKKLFLK